MYSIVLPIKNDPNTNGYKLFCEVGLPSYKQFLGLDKLSVFYIISPKADILALKSAIGDTKIPFFLLAEEQLLSPNIEAEKGWYKQQIIKLKMAIVVKTPYYLVLDSDHYLNQPFEYGNLFHNDKIKYSNEPWQTENSNHFSTNSRWWLESCKILDFPPEKLHGESHLMGVTPQLLITEFVVDLIEDLYHRHNKKINKNSNWQHFLCQNKFTEFTLYWIYLMSRKIHDIHYTWEGYPLWKHDMNTNILDYNQDTKCVDRSFSHSSSYFSVIQGYLQCDVGPYIKEFEKNMTTRHYDAIFITGSMLRPNRYQSFQIEERLQQTLKTVNSIKKHIPNSFCLLIEGSVLPEVDSEIFNRHFDYVLELGTDPNVLPFVNHPHNIGHGEMKLLFLFIFLLCR